MNRPEPMWLGLLLFATMFVGTVLYRYTTGEVTGRTAAAVFGFGFAAVVAVHAANLAPHREPTTGALLTWKSESLTFVVAYLVFGVGLLLRFRTFPRWLVFLGTISYSVYMMHTIVIYATPWWGANQWATCLRWVGLTLLAATVTYYAIERPAISCGRMLARRVRQQPARAGSTHPIAGARQ
jgi:peptidoglycan/LPS O-acetylase OafA/YrhL